MGDVTITKEVTGEVTFDTDIEVNINQIECACGKKLDFSVTLDIWGDLDIDVEEHICIQGEEE